MSGGKILGNDGNKITFDFSLSVGGLVDGKIYNLNIKGKAGALTAACTYVNADTKFNCEYTCSNYYGEIIMQKQTITEGDTSLQISNELTLQQTVEFTYVDAFVKMVIETTSPVYYLQIYVKETNIAENAFYQVDILHNGNSRVSNCTYTITSSEKYLYCRYPGTKEYLIQLAKWFNKMEKRCNG